jgi:hypothetical protein
VERRDLAGYREVVYHGAKHVMDAMETAVYALRHGDVYWPKQHILRWLERTEARVGLQGTYRAVGIVGSLWA